MASTSTLPPAPRAKTGKRYLLVCSTPLGGDHLNEFRLPELESIAQLYGFTITYDDDEPDVTRPFMIVWLPSEREARLIGERSVSVKHVWEYWCHAPSYDELHKLNKVASENWLDIVPPSVSWKFSPIAFGQTIPLPVQIEMIESFSYMAFEGPIELKKPMVEVGVFEDYLLKGEYLGTFEEAEARKSKLVGKEWNDLVMIYMGRKICDSQRHLMDVYDLKKRAYIGNTSMDAEVSLLMANQALAAPGKLVYDPFAGTGSMLLTSAAFGAVTFGSDIDGRQVRGKKTSIADSAKQYGLEGRVLDCAVFDVTQHPFRTGGIFDAIVTDPPYGVRAGAKRLGRKTKDGKPYESKPVPGFGDKVVYTHQLPDYIPPTLAWEMTSVIHTLISLASYLLTPNGRLVFFLPTDSAAYSASDIPDIPGMKMVANSEQNFGKWSRRLITMEKVGEGVEWKGVSDVEREEGSVGEEGHKEFSKKYFGKFA